MTQPPDGYPSPDPGRQHPPPADPFPATPGWDQPTRAEPQPWAGTPTPPYQPPAQPPQYPPPQSTPGQFPPPAGYGGQPPGGGPPYGPPPGLPPHSAGPPPRRRRRLLVVALGLAGVLVLCAGGGIAAWLLTRDPDRDGAETAIGAVQSFLEAVYRDQDAAAAAAVVCSEARDQDSLENKIDELRTYEETALNPTFSWTEPAVVEETEQLAILALTVTMTTDDEKTAEQTLQVSVLDKDPHGWWVCDLETVDGGEPPAGAGEPSGGPSREPSATPTDEDGE